MYYPVFLKLKDRRCVVFGGGPVAERKALSLLEAEADLLCVSKSFTAGLLKLARAGKLRLVRRDISSAAGAGSFLKRAFLAVSAVSSKAVNARVYAACQRRNIPVNAVDDPEHCSFIVPAVVKRGQLLIAVSTGGGSPVFAKTMREKLEDFFGPEYGDFVKFMSGERRKIMRWIRDPQKRKKCFEDLVASPLLKLFKEGDPRAIRREYEAILKKHGVRKAVLK